MADLGAVFIFSYGEDETKDFMSLAQESDIQDPDVHRLLHRDFFTKLQEDCKWITPGQTIYLMFPLKTDNESFLVACRVIRKVSARLGDRQYCEMVAVYIDAAQGSEKLDQACNALTTVDWDDIVRKRLGEVELRMAKPTQDKWVNAICKEIHHKSALIERSYENLANRNCLPLILDSFDKYGRSQKKIAIGICQDWAMFSDFDVLIYATKQKTKYDPGNPVQDSYARTQQAKLLLGSVPRAYSMMAGVLNSAELFYRSLNEMTIQNQAPADPQFFRILANQINNQFTTANSIFKNELGAYERDPQVTTNTIREISEAWSAQDFGLVHQMTNVCSRLGSNAFVSKDEVLAIVNSHTADLRRELEELRKSVSQGSTRVKETNQHENSSGSHNLIHTVDGHALPSQSSSFVSKLLKKGDKSTQGLGATGDQRVDWKSPKIWLIIIATLLISVLLYFGITQWDNIKNLVPKSKGSSKPQKEKPAAKDDAGTDDEDQTQPDAVPPASDHKRPKSGKPKGNA